MTDTAAAVVAGLPDTVADLASRMDCDDVPSPMSPESSSRESAEWGGPYAALDGGDDDAMDLDGADECMEIDPTPVPVTVVTAATPAQHREPDVWYMPRFVDQLIDAADGTVSEHERAVLHAAYIKASGNWARHQQRTTRRPRAVNVRDDMVLDRPAWLTLGDDERVAVADRVLASSAFGTAATSTPVTF